MAEELDRIQASVRLLRAQRMVRGADLAIGICGVPYQTRVCKCGHVRWLQVQQTVGE